tara:strand:+ start:359 stop:718 length:360 start_codon:yes stop_codon:yes gene_type:complete
MIFFSKTKKYFSFFLPFLFLFQWTLPSIDKNRITHINFGDLVFVKCNNPEHSHPPLSERKSSHDIKKFVNSEGNNLFIDNTSYKLIFTLGENKFKIFTTLSEFTLAHFINARGPPYFEV